MGGVRWSTVLFGNLFRGMVWSCEALNTVAKFCPVKYCYVRLGKAVFWQGGVEKSEVRYCLAGSFKLRRCEVACCLVRSCFLLWGSVGLGVSRSGMVIC